MGLIAAGLFWVIIMVIVVFLAGVALLIVGIVTLAVLRGKRKKAQARLAAGEPAWTVKTPRMIGSVLGILALAAGFVIVFPGGVLAVMTIRTTMEAQSIYETLSYQVENGLYARAVEMLEDGGDPDEKNAAGETLLLLACKQTYDRHQEMAIYLLDNGADPNLTSTGGQTALMKAAAG